MAKAQTETNSETAEELELDDLDEMPLYLTGGPNFSQFSGRAYPIRFDYKLFFEVGVLFQFVLFDDFPFYSGIEFQKKGYDINQFKKGILGNGKAYEDRVKGIVRIDYLNFPLLFKFPRAKLNNRFHVLAGPGISLRIRYYEKFDAVRTIPADTLSIPQSYEKTGNDALDLLDFNLSLGCRYALTKKLDLWFVANRKLFGFSIGQENFLTSKEINTYFSLKLVYKLPDLSRLNF